MAKMDTGQCLTIVQQALHQVCPAPVAKPDAPASVSSADALVAVADSIALATFALAIIVAFATVGWFVYVRHRTREEAKTEVAKVAPAQIKAYIEENLPGMVAEAVAALSLPVSGAQTDSTTTEAQAKALSEDGR